MRVEKRNGEFENVSFDKILLRIQNLLTAKLTHVDPVLIAKQVIQGLYDGVKTTELDVLAAETSAYMSSVHPDYNWLAARIAVSNLHKETKNSFFETCKSLYEYVNPKTGKHAPLVSDKFYQIAEEFKDEIQKQIDYERDFDFDYFGFKTLCKSYLLKINEKIAERPQDLFMRVAIAIHGKDLISAFRVYDNLSKKRYIHATPTLFNAGSLKPQCSSCFLLTMKDDSIKGIYETLEQCALISQCAGGIGLNVSTIRAKHSYIAGTNGHSNGLTPMLRVFNATARYVDQGGGKRKGSFAIYLEPWHADTLEFLDLKKNTGTEELRARDLFYGLWIPNLFMKRVENSEIWSFFCPNECPGLSDTYGDEFEKLYLKYETQKKFKSQIPAQEVWNKILESQIETGTPYMLYKDTCNEKSNQKNLGTIRGSNLCTEIIQFTSPDETAVCNLASVSLGSFASLDTYDFEGLMNSVKELVLNLNRIIDLNFYPIPEARNSNLKHRPIGIGVQGLADAFFKRRFSFGSEESRKLNKQIFECIYFAALSESCRIAEEKNQTYESYYGSPVSKGILQMDYYKNFKSCCPFLDWTELRKQIQSSGIYNSLLIAPMPTASTAQILGNTECFEPISSNLYTRSTLAGTFTMINEYLVRDLENLNMWNDQMKNEIVIHKGSIQSIKGIPEEIRQLYKTVWEIPQKQIVDMAIDRQMFIDQSQSMNIFMAEPTFAKLTSLHFYGWKGGLKTGSYYLRTRPAADPIQFTVNKKDFYCSRDDSNCLACN